MNLNELKQIINIKSISNIETDITFDYFRIVKYQDDEIIKDKNNVLFFPVSVSEEELKNGWYIKSFDNRLRIEEIASKAPQFTYVIEEDMIKMIGENSKYIVVDNIMESINKIFIKKLNDYKGKIVCVTGSVGKTTTVGFIKQALGDKAIRIYSKRITPLVLNNFVINFLNNDYDYFIVEASLWYKSHIDYFSKTLKPDLAVLIDVYKEHIGVGEIKSVSDITKFKANLLKYATNAIINNMDEELKKISIKDNKVYYNDEEVVPTKVVKFIKIDDYNKLITPYIKTRLSLLEETIAYEVAKFYNIDDNLILNRLNNANTVENRLIKEKIADHDVIFDGDVSGVARFKNFADHYYDKSCLIICNLTEDGEEKEPYEQLNEIFDRFDEVYINEKFKKYFNNKKIIYFNDLSFIDDVSKDTMIFMHYGSYYRVYDKFDVKKLEKR